MTVIDTFEGDLIRPLGLVTLYSAYAEGEIDEVLLAICTRDQFDTEMKRWTVGKKLSFAQTQVRALKAENLAGLIVALKDARTLFEQRNSFVHDRIYSGGRVISNSAPERRVSPDELLDLAERIFNCKEQICAYRQRQLSPLLKSRASAVGPNNSFNPKPLRSSKMRH